MIAIVQKDNAVLRQAAKEIPVRDIKSPRIQKVIKAMREALESQPDGVAIAAPQIGESLRIFVVSHRIEEFAKAQHETTDATEGESPLPKNADEPKGHDQVFINPTMLKLSRDKKLMEEGCLSVRWLYGKVKRATKATISAYDEHGQRVKRGASGLLAQVFQHEVDHLDGTLFTDKAVDVREMKPETSDA